MLYANLFLPNALTPLTFPFFPMNSLILSIFFFSSVERSCGSKITIISYIHIFPFLKVRLSYHNGLYEARNSNPSVSHMEAELNNVSVPHLVFFPFKTQESEFFRFFPGADFNKPFHKIRVYCSCCLFRRHPSLNRPRPDFVRTNGEK